MVGIVASLLATFATDSGAADVACPRNPAQGPRALIFSGAASGTDFDEGWTGVLHNFTFATGVNLTYCLSGCNREGVPNCVGQGSTGPGSLNGSIFGPPLPFVFQRVPVCLTHTFADTLLTAEYNVDTGAFEGSLPLTTNVFFTFLDNVCPRCVGGQNFGDVGVCDGGQNFGQPCRVEGFQTVDGGDGDPLYALSSQCPPSAGTLVAESEFGLTLTTATTSLANSCPGQQHPTGCAAGAPCVCDGCPGRPVSGGGIHQCCCEDTNIPCFPDTISRVGARAPATPRWPDVRYPKTSRDSVLVGSFCAAATHGSVVNLSVGLPAPAAVILPVEATLLGPICGDGIAELGEACDRGEQNGAAGSCCAADCSLRPSPFTCRAAATECDLAEECDGEVDVCPADRFAAADRGCVDGNPCTLEDACADGRCTSGVTVCDATVLRGATVRGHVPPVLVVCDGQPLPGVKATCEAAGFVKPMAALLPAGRDPGSVVAARAPRCGGSLRRCTPNQGGNFQVTKSKKRPLASKSRARHPGSPTASLRLKLNACGRELYRRLGSVPIDIPVTLRGIRTDDPDRKTVTLPRVIQLAGGLCR